MYRRKSEVTWVAVLSMVIVWPKPVRRKYKHRRESPRQLKERCSGVDTQSDDLDIAILRGLCPTDIAIGVMEEIG